MVSDVIIIGDGLIGLSTALELGRAGTSCIVVGARRPGAASAAAAGLLAPSVGDLSDAERSFFYWALDQYPAFLERLRPYDAGLRLIEGLLERTPVGERLYERDGAIDNVRLLAAVERAVGECQSIARRNALVVSIERGVAGLTTKLSTMERLIGANVVIAAGAWSADIAGLPRRLPVRPLKGQMIALGAAPLTRAVMGDDVYLVPRGSETLVGATVEERGFDVTVTTEAIERLRASAVRLCPELDGAPVMRSWAGVRPATPDMLPIIGADPDWPNLFYAAGHSKNGILLAPATAAALSSLVRGDAPPRSVAPFSIGRFG